MQLPFVVYWALFGCPKQQMMCVLLPHFVQPPKNKFMETQGMQSIGPRCSQDLETPGALRIAFKQFSFHLQEVMILALDTRQSRASQLPPVGRIHSWSCLLSSIAQDTMGEGEIYLLPGASSEGQCISRWQGLRVLLPDEPEKMKTGVFQRLERPCQVVMRVRQGTFLICHCISTAVCGLEQPRFSLGRSQ